MMMFEITAASAHSCAAVVQRLEPEDESAYEAGEPGDQGGNQEDRVPLSNQEIKILEEGLELEYESEKKSPQNADSRLVELLTSLMLGDYTTDP
jgi:hypothetical protein